MSLFKNFLRKYLHDGMGIEVIDPKAKNQCFDLVVAWLDFLDIPRLPNGSSIFNHRYAYQIWTEKNSTKEKYFTWLENTPDFVPNEGDIAVWKPNKLNGFSGHTAVSTGKGDKTWFEAYSQNDPMGSYDALIRYTYNDVYGFLRPKNYTPNEEDTEEEIGDEDQRAYWFDLINKVVWNKPHEQLHTGDIQYFVKEYPSRAKRAGLWDSTARLLGYKGDTNKLTEKEIIDLSNREQIVKLQKAEEAEKQLRIAYNDMQEGYRIIEKSYRNEKARYRDYKDEAEKLILELRKLTTELSREKEELLKQVEELSSLPRKPKDDTLVRIEPEGLKGKLEELVIALTSYFKKK